jgi:rhodanese-related sulfurtransferase
MTPQHAYDERDALQLLDVREHDELVLARFPGAIHLPMGQLPGRLHELDRGTPVAVVCRSGNRSARVADALRRAGFTADDVEGGLRAWIRAGLPLAT